MLSRIASCRIKRALKRAERRAGTEPRKSFDCNGALQLSNATPLHPKRMCGVCRAAPPACGVPMFATVSEAEFGHLSGAREWRRATALPARYASALALLDERSTAALPEAASCSPDGCLRALSVRSHSIVCVFVQRSVIDQMAATLHP